MVSEWQDGTRIKHLGAISGVKRIPLEKEGWLRIKKMLRSHR
jgi:hypothetical protein